ncbi:MAG: fibronectin type III domain-containing protein, partial [Bacteroidales bacterium]|nr:fibronectin type III domain-containing protein [Bacteroidales bacterium]
ETVDNNGVAGWQNKSYPISTYAIAGDYVKFRITANWISGDYCIGFDNFNLASCFPISGLSVANIEENSATISWNASTSSPANYNVYYSEVNAAPANDIADTEYSDEPGTTYNLTDLTEGTKYYVWVRSACGVGDFSTWDGPIVFTTLCTPVNVPFFEGFENGYNHDDVVEGCWTQESLAGAEFWTANQTYVDYNRTPRTGLFNATLQYSNKDWLFYKVNLIQGESYDFSVWARQDVTSGATLTLACGTESNAAAMTIVIVDEQAIISGDYQEVKGTFSVPTDGTYYIGIKGTLNYDPWYLSIDDISLKYTPTCFQPTNIVASDITTNSATISWTASSSNPDADYHVYYSNLNVAPADDIELAECEATTTNSIALSDLTDAEIYYVWVRSDCGGGDYSYWTGPFVLATECYAITTLPYFQDFEGGFTIPCWSFVDNHASVSSNWHVVSDGNPGNGLVVYYTDDNMMDEWAISPTFDLTGITESVILSFDFYMDYYYQVNPYDGADLMVKVSTDDGSTWTQIWREEDFGVFDSYEWYSVNLPFDTYLGQSNVKFAFHYLGDDGNDLAIDNVRLDYAPSSEAEILTYTIPNQVGETTIDPAGQTVELTVPYAMEVTDLVATFTLSDGASAKIGTVDQESGVTGNNFTNPVTYTVTAEDGVTFKDWTVTVNLAPVSTEAEILTYSLPNQVGEAEINSGATEGTITVTMPYDTEVANLVANFTLSYGATAKVGAIDQETGVTPNNFTDPVVYAVTAQDGSTIKNWTVTVNLEDAPSSEANILTYSFAEQYSPAVIDDVNHTVTVVVNEGTSLDALVATFTLSPGASAKIGAVDQESGVTENNFTDPVIYTVTAEDGTTTQPWTVTVSVYVGIEDVENSALAIYPNPNNGNFTLDFTNINGKVNYQIFDTKGSIILNENFVANGNAIKEVSLNLVPGVYFVKLITENQSLIEKLIIE